MGNLEEKLTLPFNALPHGFNMKYALPKLASCLFLISSLSACGGGGGSVETSQNTNATLQSSVQTPIGFPIGLAVKSFYSQASSHTLTTTVNNDNFRLVEAYMPRLDAIEPNLSSSPLKSVLLTGSIFVNNIQVAQSSTIGFYSADPFQIWGESFETTPGAFVTPSQAISKTPLPETAQVGQSGVLGTWRNNYLDANNNLIESPRSLSWSLEIATENTAWLCLKDQERDKDGVYAQSRCIQIDQSGNRLGYKVDVIVPMGTFQFR